jgi:hypothetical protein
MISYDNISEQEAQIWPAFRKPFHGLNQRQQAMENTRNERHFI